MQKVWAVKQNADFTEGRGPMIPKWVFTHFGAACDFVETVLEKGPCGERLRIGAGLATQQCWYEVQSMPLFSSIEVTPEFKAKESDKVRELLRHSALAKLTPEERAALDLN